MCRVRVRARGCKRVYIGVSKRTRFASDEFMVANLSSSKNILSRRVVRVCDVRRVSARARSRVCTNTMRRAFFIIFYARRENPTENMSEQTAFRSIKPLPCDLLYAYIICYLIPRGG